MVAKKQEKPVEVIDPKHKNKAKEWQEFYSTLARKLKASK